MKRRIISCLMLVILVCLCSFVGALASEDITVYVNETVLNCDTTPFIENGRTLVPMRSIFEALGATVEWNDEEKKITATKADTVITMQIDGAIMYKNGIGSFLDVAPKIVNSRTFVPVRAVSQSLDATVEWVGETKTVYINSPIAYETYLSTPKLAIVTMYAPDGRTTLIYEDEVQAYISQGWYQYPVTTVYAPDGRTSLIYQDELSAYLSQGWYQYPVITVYAPDGRTSLIYQDELSAYLSQGWYQYPVVTVYAPDGRTSLIYQDELSAYLSQGWYQYPVTIMYASDGRTTVIYTDEVSAYQNVGWYRTYAEAQAANKIQQSQSVSSGNSSSNSNNSGGSAVYRTPSGKKYHFDPDCGGKNSYQTTLSKAKGAGLTPCSKCAY